MRTHLRMQRSSDDLSVGGKLTDLRYKSNLNSTQHHSSKLTSLNNTGFGSIGVDPDEFHRNRTPVGMTEVHDLSRGSFLNQTIPDVPHGSYRDLHGYLRTPQYYGLKTKIDGLKNSLNVYEPSNL